MRSNCQIERRADFSFIRYAQCWEDTDVVLTALAIKENDICLSIASAGDNSLSMLAKSPGRVIAIDLNPAQLALTELKAVSIKHLSYKQVLELFGYEKSDETMKLFALVLPYLSDKTSKYWLANIDSIRSGIARCGKFENYFAIFRKFVLPLVHNKKTIESLLQAKSLEKRREFYETYWNTWRWRLMFSLFFSNTIMALLGRDRSFFKFVQKSLPEFLKDSVYDALVTKDPTDNPYLHWILLGRFDVIKPYWLEEKNFQAIKANIDRLEIRKSSLEEFLEDFDQPIDAFNLSDVFEYMSEDAFKAILGQIGKSARSGARIAYWNMLVDRHTEKSYNLAIKSRDELSNSLYEKNKTFFYTRFIAEEVAA